MKDNIKCKDQQPTCVCNMSCVPQLKLNISMKCTHLTPFSTASQNNTCCVSFNWTRIQDMASGLNRRILNDRVLKFPLPRRQTPAYSAVTIQYTEEIWMKQTYTHTYSSCHLTKCYRAKPFPCRHLVYAPNLTSALLAGSAHFLTWLLTEFSVPQYKFH